MASIQNSTKDYQRHSKSSHPEGHFRDKSKYNNRNGRFANRNSDSRQSQEQQTSREPNISQEKLTEHLTAKLLDNKFVNVKTKEIKNERGVLFEIDVINPGLQRIGNGTFFSMKLHTVSHKSRIIYIRIIFNDNEERNADMRINADSIIQIFREIASETLENISITDVDDSKGNKHLAVLANTIKGASLIYTYERAMEFIHAVDKKYSSSNSTSEIGASASQDDMSTDQIDAETALLEKKLKALLELKKAKTGQEQEQVEPQDSPQDTAPCLPRPPRPPRRIKINNKSFEITSSS